MYTCNHLLPYVNMPNVIQKDHTRIHVYWSIYQIITACNWYTTARYYTLPALGISFRVELLRDIDTYGHLHLLCVPIVNLSSLNFLAFVCLKSNTLFLRSNSIYAEWIYAYILSKTYLNDPSRHFFWEFSKPDFSPKRVLFFFFQQIYITFQCPCFTLFIYNLDEHQYTWNLHVMGHWGIIIVLAPTMTRGLF